MISHDAGRARYSIGRSFLRGGLGTILQASRRVVVTGLLLAIAMAAPAQVEAPTGDVALVRVPALTSISLTIGDAISSNANRPGDRFRLTVIADVAIDGVVVIPAGTTGEGEVVHAAKSSAGGKAGELILTARYLRVGEQQVRLRSFHAGVGAGEDRTVQALATSMVAGPFAMFLRGGVITIPADTPATAKTLDTVTLPAAAPMVGVPDPSSVTPAPPAADAPDPTTHEPQRE